MPNDDSNVAGLELHNQSSGVLPDPLYRRIPVRPGYHIVVSLAPEFDARIYYVSRNEKLHPDGWIVQCEQRYVLPADFVTPFDTFSQALDFVARDISIYNLFYTRCCARDGLADRMDR